MKRLSDDNYKVPRTNGLNYFMSLLCFLQKLLRPGVPSSLKAHVRNQKLRVCTAVSKLTKWFSSQLWEAHQSRLFIFFVSAQFIFTNYTGYFLFFDRNYWACWLHKNLSMILVIDKTMRLGDVSATRAVKFGLVWPLLVEQYEFLQLYILN